ncbi:MAG TPA: hypothetical protein VMF13_18365 [Luteitalea sp.]|nr:hypothetical protein [Luteitalea sp.]
MWRQILREARSAHAPLVAFAALSVVFAALTAVATVVDPRTITGAPAWNKPFKFFVSTAIYGATFAWYLAVVRESAPDDARTRADRIGYLCGYGVLVALVIELVLISMQAWRGVTSHFNRTTPFDGLVFDVMGGAIFTLTALHAVLIVLLLRAKGRGRPLLAACRWGAIVAMIGLGVGGLMVAPSAEQITVLKRGAGGIQGGHTIGAPDGGAGLPVVNWSTEAGDNRAPHFIGLHAMQVLPLVALLVPATWPTRQILAAVNASGLAYAILTLAMIVQASQGRPVLRPGIVIATLLAATLVGWAAAMVACGRRAAAM